MTHGINMDSCNWQRIKVYTWSHGIDRYSWYRHELMVQTQTHGIDSDSWYRLQSQYRHELRVLTAPIPLVTRDTSCPGEMSTEPVGFREFNFSTPILQLLDPSQQWSYQIFCSYVFLSFFSVNVFNNCSHRSIQPHHPSTSDQTALETLR